MRSWGSNLKGVVGRWIPGGGRVGAEGNYSVHSIFNLIFHQNLLYFFKYFINDLGCKSRSVVLVP